MKTTIKQLEWVIRCLLFLVILGCSKNEDDGPEMGEGDVEQINGISAEDLENYTGDLGILINTRELVKKGYNPTSVQLSTDATEGNYDQQIEIDPFTGIAQLSYAVDELSEAAASELKNGISLEINVLSNVGSVITQDSFSTISFRENGNQIDIDASALSYVAQNLDFQEGARHYLQTVNPSGAYGNRVVWKPSSALGTNVLLEEKSTSFNRGTTSEQYLFYKFPGTQNTFAIWSANTGRYLATDSNDKTFRQSGAYSYPDGIFSNTLHPRYRFIVKLEPNGLYTINDIDGNPMRRFSSGGKLKWRTNGSGTIQYFRIINLDINWQPEVLNTEYLRPILPSVDTSFGFNSTLRNCGSGSLEQEVGIERTVETTYTSSFSESIGLSSRQTASVDVTVSATAEASFFGNGGSVTGEVSAGLELSTEASSTTTIGSEETVSDAQTFFSSRTVTVPAGSASLVYDAYQTYSNVKIPYVQRIRLKGSLTDGGALLSGLSIASQLRMTNFTGVITTIGVDFVEITVKGNMFLDNIVDTQTEVRDVAANCN